MQIIRRDVLPHAGDRNYVFQLMMSMNNLIKIKSSSLGHKIFWSATYVFFPILLPCYASKLTIFLIVRNLCYTIAGISQGNAVELLIRGR